jgi:hypothetical protein
LCSFLINHYNNVLVIPFKLYYISILKNKRIKIKYKNMFLFK